MSVSTTETRPLGVRADGARLDADLHVPEGARAVVVFAHGSGSGRDSPRNRAVADALHRAGFATVLVDLLTAAEDAEDRRSRRCRFDVELLGSRVTAVVDALAGTPATAELPVVVFGASTGAGAAVVAAAERPDRVVAVVSRGGRPDLAHDALDEVQVPVLLVVGDRDTHVLERNKEAQHRLGADADLALVPGAGHLFEEPGTLDAVVDLTVAALRRWFP